MLRFMSYTMHKFPITKKKHKMEVISAGWLPEHIADASPQTLHVWKVMVGKTQCFYMANTNHIQCWLVS